ncbi:MAG: T9SS type B sorting domain-containing protein [Flavobacteriales bacterium]|nr:T9SS type B sorting domain-containing protein [Flavobacteriales bacterium]
MCNRLLKKLLFCLALVLISDEAFSSHAAGMDITYKFVGIEAGIPGNQININVTSGNFPNEISWDIYNTVTGVIIATGGAPYSGTVCIPTNNLGSLQFRMYDSWGDGWNGATYTLSGNGTLSGSTTGTALYMGGIGNGGPAGSNTFSITGGTTCTTTETLTYEITLAFYRECANGNATAPSSFEIRWEEWATNNNGGYNTTNLSSTGPPTNVTPVCQNITNPCASSLAYAYEKYTYTGIITFPNRDSWKVWNAPLNARNNTTFGPAGGFWLGQNLCVVANIDNTTHLSSSPVFSSDPISFLCTGGDCFFNGATDVDLDDLSYSLTPPKTDEGLNDNMNYQNGTYLLPFPTGTATCDPITGDLCINTSSIGTSVTAIKVTEKRNGTPIGFVTRDIQVWSRSCTNTNTTNTGTTINPVTISAFDDTTKTFNFCANGSNQLSFTTDAYSTNNLEMSHSVLPNGATFTTNPILALSSDTVMGIFNWIPTLADVAGSPYILNIIINDDNCPFPNSTNITYIINLTTGLNDSIISTITDVSCNGVNNGNISLSITGNQGPYSYLWSTGDSLQSISNLPGGVYNVLVTDSFGCSNTQSFTVIEPAAFTASVSSTNISCFGANDGTASINTNGIPATYLWNNLSTIDSIASLSAGNYSVDITDSNGCTLTDYVTITEPLAINTSTSTSGISCNGLTDGNISLTINGGIPDYTINVPPYNQTLIGGVNTFITPSLLGAGTYNYSITDSNGCVFNSSVTLIEPAPISVTENQTDVSCNGGNDGSIILTINGGTPTYTQNWGVNNPLALSVGTANYQITDNNGCIYTDSVIITEPNLLTISFTKINVSNCLAADGSIDVTISGGTTPYYYNWSNGSSTEDLNNLSGGIYLLTVTDNKGCTATLNVTISEPPSPILSFTQTDVSCNGGNDGGIDLTVNGGTSPFTYVWTTNETTQDINNLSAGQYTVQVSDDNSCIENITITITQPSAPSISTTQINVDCNGNNTGSIDLTVLGSSSVYTFLWSNGQSTEDIINLLAGNYSYTITDVNNCTYTNSLTISEPNILAINPITVNVNCKGEDNGYIILNTIGGTAPYSEDFGTANPAALIAGNYPFTITDNNGCIYSNNINISEPDSLLVSASSTNATCGGYFDGTATLATTGGTPAYNTNWGLSNPNGLNAGTHNYIITDANNCLAQGSVTITEPPAMQIIVDTFRVSCFGLSDGSATLTISAGAGAPYTQDWGVANPNSLPAGIHPFVITDSNNCTAQGDAIITQPADIQINELLSHVSCFGENNGTAFLQVNGGISPYIENWNNVNILALSAGSYSYSVTDANNCVKNNYITINEPDTLTATTTIIDANCFNSNDGKIYLNITGGTSPYTEDFGIFNPIALAEGSYNFTVTDINGCSFDSNAVVNQANEVFLSFSAESPICRNDLTELSININNPTTNLYTVIINDSIAKPYVIDSLGLLIPEGIKPKLSPNFTTDIILLTVSDDEGCSSSADDTINVIVNQLPVLDITLTDICVGSPSFMLNEGTPSGGNYFINGKSTNFFDVENLENGEYLIGYDYTDTLTNCSNSIEKIININPSPNAEFSFSPQPANIDDPNILFNNNSTDIENTIWNLGDGTILANELNFWHTYADTGKYEVIYVVNNQFNCVDSLSATLIINPVYQIFIPNSFTPNNDGDNDTFKPFVNGAKDYTITIFDRWGEIIFQDDNGIWDGKVNGNFVQDGVYSYSILAIDFKDKPFIYTGIVTLLK